MAAARSGRSPGPPAGRKSAAELARGPRPFRRSRRGKSRSRQAVKVLRVRALGEREYELPERNLLTFTLATGGYGDKICRT